ncbi:MAG: hypothetical protein QW461_09120 [Candidatus Jordarchaeales archaeon]
MVSKLHVNITSDFSESLFLGETLVRKAGAPSVFTREVAAGFSKEGGPKAGSAKKHLHGRSNESAL